MKVESLAFSPDGSTLALGTGPKRAICPFGMPVSVEGGNVYLLDANTGRVRKTLARPKRPGSSYTVRRLAFAADASWLATYRTEEDGSPYTDMRKRIGGEWIVWDLKTGRPRHVLPIGSLGLSVVSADGNSLIVSRADGTIRSWDFASGTPRTIASGLLFEPSEMAASPDGRSLAVLGTDDVIRVLDTKTGAIAAVFGAARLPSEWKVDSLIFAGRSKLVAASSTEDVVPDAPNTPRGRLTVFNLLTKRVGTTIRRAENVHPASPSPDGRTLAWPGRSGSIVLFDVASSTARETERHESFEWTEIRFAPSGEWVAAGTWAWVSAWAVGSGKFLGTVEAFDESGFAIDPARPRIAVGGFDVEVLDLQRTAPRP